MANRHNIAEWLRYSAYGLSGPSQNRLAILDIIIHYTGGNTSILDDEDMARLLARINDQYMRDPNRGYSIGYNFGCATHNGDLWDARAHNLRCAANGCQLVNVPAVAILVPTPNISAQPSLAQDNALKNQWIPMLQAYYPNARTHVLGHRDVRNKCGDGGSTACPGEPIYSRIRVNFYDTAGQPPPPPVPGDDDMKWLVRCADGSATQKAQTFAWDGQCITHIPVAKALTLGDFVGLYGNSGQVLTNFTAAEIQVMINSAYNGPANAAIPGFVAPPGPATAAATAAGFTAGAKQSTLVDVQTAVGKIPTTSTPGSGGMSEEQVKTIVNNTRLQVD